MKKQYFLFLALFIVMVLPIVGCVGQTSLQQTQVPLLPPLAYADETAKQAGFIWSQQNVGLWVSGEGKVTATPDIALLSLGVESQQKTVAEAQRQANEAMNQVMKVLKDKGVADKDIQTQQFNIDQVTQWDEKVRKNIITGYRVSNIVAVKVRKIADAGSIVDAVATAAGDTTRINGINFTIDDPSPYYTQAREKAIKYAMDKAKQISSVAGIKIGKVLYVSEGSSYNPPVVRNYLKAAGDMALAPSASPISSGELDIQATVQIVYSIE